MSKLRLDVEALEIESFDTAEKEGERGTVLGASYIETFQAWCSFDGPCTGTCTEPTQPGGACQSVPGEVCPQLPPGGLGTA